jgi:hypothetical protein
MNWRFTPGSRTVISGLMTTQPERPLHTLASSLAGDTTETSQAFQRPLCFAESQLENAKQLN